jgi:hypothetical protein
MPGWFSFALSVHFFAALCFAHLLRCAAAIFSRASALISRLLRGLLPNENDVAAGRPRRGPLWPASRFLTCANVSISLSIVASISLVVMNCIITGAILGSWAKLPICRPHVKFWRPFALAEIPLRRQTVSCRDSLTRSGASRTVRGATLAPVQKRGPF